MMNNMYHWDSHVLCNGGGDGGIVVCAPSIEEARRIFLDRIDDIEWCIPHKKQFEKEVSEEPTILSGICMYEGPGSCY
jgi:hypothetical protein